MNIHEYDDWKNWDESLQRYHIKKALEEIHTALWELIYTIRKQDK